MKERIKDLMKQVFGLDNVTDDISQLNCDKWDSLNHLHLVVELEEEFEISFEPEDISKMKDINLIIAKIQELKQ